MERFYYVYILASRSRKLYVGVTNDLARRIEEHRSGKSAHTARYRITRLVHVEATSDIRAAISREKQIKAWRRDKKLELIHMANPGWLDLMPEDPHRRLGNADPSLRSG
ncbi:MAG TPA: GIY-YIG nuclease family protein [Gemmatimonadaceae bacterium]|nr:GIY-YIG nuclease family protein [Gemmatimonadaceae bacterium]